MRLIARWFAFCLLFSPLTVSAAELEGGYQVREPVASQEPEERAAALGRALQTLVVRLTGDRQAAGDLRLKPLLADPEQLVQQYLYEPGEPVTLSVVFDPQLSRQALSAAGLQLLGERRASVLVWWLNEQDGNAALLSEDQADAALLRRAAENRGVPLRLPLGDLDEQLLASAETLRGDGAALQQASTRYATDSLLAVLAQPAGAAWQADWQLWVAGQRVSGSSQGTSQAALADALLLDVSEQLAARFAAAAQTLTLEVHGNDLQRYAELQRLLAPFAPRLQSVAGDRVVYQLDAGAEQLRSQLQLGRLHELAADAPLDAQAPLQVPVESAGRLRFSW